MSAKYKLYVQKRADFGVRCRRPNVETVVGLVAVGVLYLKLIKD